MPNALASPPTALPTCRCGHDRTHHWVRPEMRYGAKAWMLLFYGATAVPSEITFRCAQCGEAFETTRDPQLLKQYRRR